MRSMVEGASHLRFAQPPTPSTATRSPSPCRGGSWDAATLNSGLAK